MKIELRNRTILPLALAVTAAMLSCTKSGTQSANDGSAVAAVTTRENTAIAIDQTTFRKAQSVIAKVDYLPYYNWGEDCESRSIWMSLELANNNIAGNLITAFPKRDTKLWPTKLAPQRVTAEPLTESGHWTYHVALSFNVGGTEMVIDPGLSATPLTQDQWLKLIGTTKAGVEIWYDVATNWRPPMNRQGGEVQADTRVASVSKMPQMYEGNMLSLAGNLLKFSTSEGSHWTTADNKEAQREHDALYDRAAKLRDALVTKKVVDAAEAGADDQITNDNLDSAEENVD